MKVSEIISQSLHYFGKDRRPLQDLLSSYEFTGREHKAWKTQLKSFTRKPFDISYGIFDDVVDHLIEKNYAKIDWNWLGDLSWDIRFVLNEDIEKVYDFDKKLASKCGGTVKIARVYVSDIVPVFVIDTYYMIYDRKNNFWEFGPLELHSEEDEFVVSIKSFLLEAGYTFLKKATALKTFPDLRSDCKEDNVSLFDVLFTDTNNYQLETQRFNDKTFKDKTGKAVRWNEYFDRFHNLEYREEYIYYPSKNVVFVRSDKKRQITEIKVWRDIGKAKHKEFKLDILAEHKNTFKEPT